LPSAFLGAATQHAEQGAIEDGEDGPAQAVVEGHEVAKAVGDGEDVLADGQATEDVVDEIGGALVHAPAGAARADRATLA